MTQKTQHITESDIADQKNKHPYLLCDMNLQ